MRGQCVTSVTTKSPEFGKILLSTKYNIFEKNSNNFSEKTLLI